MKIPRSVTPVLLLALLSPIGLAAQYQPQDDPPTRVARLSFLGGSVPPRPAGMDDWTDASVNYPLSSGDDLWSDADGRTEITLGSTALRLAPRTAIGFLALDDQTTQIRLSEGSVQVRVRDLEYDEVFEIDTPNGAVTLLRPGSYRIDVQSAGDETMVTVREGEAELAAAGSVISANDGETATVVGMDSPRYDIDRALRPDSWEQWCAARDRRRDFARSAQYMSRDLPGYE